MVNLVEEGFDVGVRLFRDKLPGDANTMSRVLTHFTFGLYASPAYVERNALDESHHNYLQQDYVGMSLLNLENESWIHDATHSTKQFQFPTPKWKTNNLSALRELTVCGAGIAILETFVAEPMVQKGLLVCLAPGWQLNAGKAALVWPASRYLKPSVRAFIEHAAGAIARGS